MAKQENKLTKSRLRVYVVYLILNIFVVFVLIEQFIKGNYYNVFLCLMTMFLFYLPKIIDKNLNITLPSLLEIMIILFIFCAEILGEIQQFYVMFPYWDMILHAVNGFIMAAIGFALVDILNQNEKLKFSMSPVYVVLVAFCFSMTAGVVWEFFEYFMDIILNKDMQKDAVITAITSVNLGNDGKNLPVTLDNITKTMIMYYKDNTEMQTVIEGGYIDIGLHDTMWDMLLNFAGAVTFSVIGFFYIKGRGRGSIFKKFVPTLKTSEEKEIK